MRLQQGGIPGFFDAKRENMTKRGSSTRGGCQMRVIDRRGVPTAKGLGRKVVWVALSLDRAGIKAQRTKCCEVPSAVQVRQAEQRRGVLRPELQRFLEVRPRQGGTGEAEMERVYHPPPLIEPL